MQKMFAVKIMATNGKSDIVHTPPKPSINIQKNSVPGIKKNSKHI